MLRDLLPACRLGAANGKVPERVIIRLSLPPGWIAHSNEAPNVRGDFEIADADLAVFALGDHLRISTATASGMTLSLVLAGEWAFTDAEAIELASKVLKAHQEVFGAAPSRQATLILFPFPQSGAPDKWSAETRGSSVTLLIGKLPSKVAALAQLSVPLTHEFMHFWVPNGLALSGDYDWFYEGFTVYQAARIGVRLDLLTFPEFLNAISRAYDGYSLGLDRDRWSVVEAAKRRWTVGESSVYSKSMLIAFLYDLNLRSVSHRKHSLDDVYRNVFREYRSEEMNTRGAGSQRGQGSDGTEAALKALSFFPGLQEFGRSFVSSPVAINLAELLAPFGLRVETLGLRTRISVSESLTRQQRDLLHDLGYNDYVRSPKRGKPS
jgi:predicted metalloprotease with PDZ domain